MRLPPALKAGEQSDRRTPVRRIKHQSDSYLLAVRLLLHPTLAGVDLTSLRPRMLKGHVMTR